ncbi:MAG: glycosyltransferase family 9 protein [Bacteroidota bacterium]
MSKPLEMPVHGSDDDRSPRSIALLQLGKFGDSILTTPLLDGLKRIYPNASITVICASELEIFFNAQPSVHAVLTVPRGFRQIPLLAARLRSKTFDLYIDFKDHISRTSRTVIDFVHAERIVAHRLNALGDGNIIELPDAASPGHYVDKALAPLRALAPGKEFRRRPTIHIPIEAFQAVDGQLDPGENGMITVNISAGDQSRYWEPAKWRHVIRELATLYNIAVLSSPADRALADEICTMRRETRPVRTENILQAAAVIQRSLAVITPDTSILHIASALDRPCVGLYPPSEENLRSFAPLSTKHRVVMPEDGKLVSEIRIEQVIAAFNDVMG